MSDHAMMSTDERLAYMAEHILRNFATKGDEGAIEATAEHIGLYWDPGMKARAAAMADEPRIPLSEAARAVFRRLGEEQPLD